jgi:signal transduction histidine kinase/ligand-binding sensor domain-containing protein/CheY-like chemotaxis protein
MLAAVSAAALDPSTPISGYQIRLWTTRDGIPGSTVTSIVERRNGTLLVGTFDGFTHFDGLDFAPLALEGSKGLATNRILSLAEEESERLWIGTEQRGILRSAGGRLEPVAVGAPTKGANRVFAIGIVPPLGVLVGTDRGLFRIDRSDRPGEIRYGDGRSAPDIGVIVGDRRGTVWVGGPTGLGRIVDGRIEPVASDRIRGLVTGIAPSKDGSLLVAGRDGFFRLVEGRAVPVATDLAKAGATLPTLHEDRDGNLWIGSGQGLFRWNGRRTEKLGAAAGLPEKRVHAIVEDREGNLWIGLDGAGLARIRDAFVVFPGGLRDEPIGSVLPIVGDGQGGLFVGRTCGGVLHFDGEGQAQVLAPGSALDKLCVWSLLLERGPRRRLWIGSWGGGLFRFDGRSVQQLPGGENRAFFSLFEDEAGTIWAGSDQGLWSWQAGKGAFVPIPETSSYSIAFIASSRRGGLLLGTNRGFVRWKPGSVRRLGVEQGLSHESVRAIVEDPDGVVWVGTYGGGLDRIENDRITSFGTDRGLAEEIVSAILDDGQGSLWMNGNRGISRLSRAELVRAVRDPSLRLHPVLFDAGDGMRTSEGNGGGQPAGHLDSRGRLWFPTIDGLARIDPAKIRSRKVRPTIHIEAIQADGRALAPVSGTVFPPSVRHIEIDYSGVDLGAGEKLRYRHRLEGFDPDWIDVGERRRAFYATLPPGSYRFLVSASNGEGIHSEIPAEWAFVIRPRYYQTAAFRFFVFVVLVLGGPLFYWIRVTGYRRRKAELEVLVAERTVQLAASEKAANEARERAVRASESKSEFLANMSHEIRTPMNGVLGMLRLLLEGPLSPEQRDWARAAHGSAESLLTLLNDILDLSKVEADRLELERIPFDPRRVAEEVLEILAPHAERKGIDLLLDWGAEGPARLVGDPIRFRQVLFNLVGNAVKFTEQGEVAVMATGTQVPPDLFRLEVAVRDSGIGIPADRIGTLFEKFTQADTSTTRRFGGTGLGLAISKRLVELMGGSIRVDSEPGQGALFSFSALFALPRESAAPLSPLAGRPILLLGSGGPLRESLARGLARSGALAERVDSAEEAERLAERGDASGAPWAAILVVVAGKEPPPPALPATLRRLPADRRPRLVLLLPGHRRRSVEPMKEGGWDEVLVRPVREETLVEALGGKPKATPPPPPPSWPIAAIPDPSQESRTPRVLVVEDSPVNQKLVAALLTRCGCASEIAADGQAALSKLESDSTFDLVLMDCQMPGLDGWETTRRIRAAEAERGGRIPIVALTASALAGERERCFEAGMDDFLTKPVRREDLARITGEWIGSQPGR